MLVHLERNSRSSSVTSSPASEHEGGEDQLPSNDEMLARINSAVDLLTASDGYDWFVSQTRSSATLQTVVPGTDELIRGQIFDALYPYYSRNVAVTRQDVALASTSDRTKMRVSFRLTWNPLATLLAQFGTATVPLGQMIVINGTSPDAQATTVDDYVQHRWPRLGPQVLQCIQKCISQGTSFERSLMGGKISIQLSAAESVFYLTGRITTALEIGEVLAYLVCACRSSDSTELKLSAPRFESVCDEDIILIEMRPELYAIPDDPTGSHCWHQLFRNPVIAHGHPTHTRSEKNTGLEIGAHMMAILGRTHWATVFRSVFLLKGVVSAFVPVDLTEHTVSWHFVMNSTHQEGPTVCDEGCVAPIHRLSYNDALSAVVQAAPSESIGLSSLASKRHFVGLWTESTLR